DRIAEVPKLACCLDLLHLEIRDRRVKSWVPVDQALVPVDEAFLVELNEDLADGRRKTGVHGEALARPIWGSAEATELPGDGAARLRLPLPNLLQEGFATQLGAARLTAFSKLPLHHHLRGNPRMDTARLPKCVSPAHSVPADQYVLNRKGQRVAHMKAARDVGRRHHEHVGIGLAL